jgi:hypothetical protein
MSIEVIYGGDGRFTVKLHGHLLDRFNDKRGVREARKFKSREAAEKAARYQNEVNRATASI